MVTDTIDERFLDYVETIWTFAWLSSRQDRATETRIGHRRDRTQVLHPNLHYCNADKIPKAIWASDPFFLTSTRPIHSIQDFLIGLPLYITVIDHGYNNLQRCGFGDEKFKENKQMLEGNILAGKVHQPIPFLFLETLHKTNLSSLKSTSSRWYNVRATLETLHKKGIRKLGWSFDWGNLHHRNSEYQNISFEVSGKIGDQNFRSCIHRNRFTVMTKTFHLTGLRSPCSVHGPAVAGRAVLLRALVHSATIKIDRIPNSSLIVFGYLCCDVTSSFQ